MWAWSCVGRHVYLCHAPAIEASEACRACDKLNVTQMGGVASPFDPSGATEGQTLTNTCQTKLLGTTKDRHYGPIGCGPRGWDHGGSLTHKHTHVYRKKKNGPLAETQLQLAIRGVTIATVWTRVCEKNLWWRYNTSLFLEATHTR